MIAMQKTMALPTPSGVASARRNVSPNRPVVSSQRWVAAVQMTRIRVRTCPEKKRGVSCANGVRGSRSEEKGLPHGAAGLTAENRNVRNEV